jgi:hypothetical protein
MAGTKGLPQGEPTYRQRVAEGGRRRVGDPGRWLSRGKHVGRSVERFSIKPEMRCRAVTGEVTDPMLPRKAQQLVGTVPVPQTDTGGRVENTKAIGRTVVKELGKIHP